MVDLMQEIQETYEAQHLALAHGVLYAHCVQGTLEKSLDCLRATDSVHWGRITDIKGQMELHGFWTDYAVEISVTQRGTDIEVVALGMIPARVDEIVKKIVENGIEAQEPAEEFAAKQRNYFHEEVVYYQDRVI